LPGLPAACRRRRRHQSPVTSHQSSQHHIVQITTAAARGAVAHAFVRLAGTSTALIAANAWTGPKGVKFGRKPKLSDYQRKEALTRRDAGEPLVDIGRSYNVSHSTISRL
jgi:hypothetical protein